MKMKSDNVVGLCGNRADDRGVALSEVIDGMAGCVFPERDASILRCLGEDDEFEVGIAPMGEACFPYRTLIRSRFEEGRDAALKGILANIGLSDKYLGVLSFSDQARFAVEMFRRTSDSEDSDLVCFYRT